ncbi:quercetin dioxygenase-like cupin family protein [Silvibacterium bohemicum]|uniref:Quercetin dioxygenase-like cupin family protein n=1 Tax=Silvibacterium bohemicum TaxID=1577686 RepID=A0A841K1C6_9BACT|nr:cupin domain-containing protein [Silvibacterium bohemicum]MBB6144458.1 quercetin dioxygenase-like cupin family protein [Silvibacterium bohemicum]
MTISNANPIPSQTADQIFDVLGVQIEFLVSPEETGVQASIYKGTLPPGIVIPLHSHPDSEVFYVLEGALELYQESGEHKGWQTVPSGKAVAVKPHVKHALRNSSSSPSTTVAVTQQGLYDFFRQIANPAKQGPPSPPTPEDMLHLFAVAAEYSYWLGSPDENAAIGIHLQ